MTMLDLSIYAALGAMGLLTANILLGLLLSTRYNPKTRWPRRPINLFAVHNWTGYIALVVAVLHPVLLLFSAKPTFRIIDILFPLRCQKTLGGVEASGGKLTLEADIAHTYRLFTRPVTLEAEGLFSNYGTSKTTVIGFSTLFQISVFDTEWAGDLDPFVRYDVVSLGESKIAGRAIQRALRTGVNYNLPFTQKLLNLHAEYGLNHVSGPVEIVPTPGDSGEFRLGVRVNLTRYLRH